ncbi:gliding motility protein GldB-related protein [Psychroflexus salinarum]
MEARNHTSTYNTYFNKIKDSYPSAGFPPTYLSIGFFNTQGRMIYPNTVFIGLEASIKTDSTNYKEFPENYSWLQREQASYKDLGFIIVHENLHTLQKNNLSDNSILNQAIVEGAAVFLTEYFCGKESLIGDAGINKMIDYAKANNKTLWIEFKNDLSQPGKFSEWFWNDDSKYPYSMGYYMGYMICKSYYENSANKKKAIKILIEAKESKTIYEQSKYSQNSM